MTTRVLLTIDTELLWRDDGACDDWHALFCRSYDPAGVGVPWQLEVLARHGLKACFFVDPMPALLYGIEPIRRMVAPILAAGQEVQLHLHPTWAGAGFELPAHNEAAQRLLIEQAADLLVRAGAPAPTAFRAGSYAADDATLRALASLGIRYDSSHNGSQHPWPSAISLPPEQIAPIRHQGMIEVPVTQIADGGGLRHLQICAVSFAELRDAINHAIGERHPVATIVSHSFEMATRDGTRPNAVHMRRFEALCGWLSDHRDQAPTAFFRDLGDLPLDREAAMSPSGLWSRFVRQIEQGRSNLIDEWL